jgi:hypothetical protein
VKRTRILEQADASTSDAANWTIYMNFIFHISVFKNRSAMVAPWDALDDCGPTTMYLHDFLLVIDQKHRF